MSKMSLIKWFLSSEDVYFDGHAWEKTETLVFLRNEKDEKVRLSFDKLTFRFKKATKEKGIKK